MDLAYPARNLLIDLDDTGQSFRFLIRDHDRTFSPVFDTVVTAAGTGILTTPVRAPQANAIAGRFGQPPARTRGGGSSVERSEREE